MSDQKSPSSAGSSLLRKTTLVSIGMLLSRIAGLLRQMVFSKYFGLAAEADAFNTALRIPNFLQNLFGDGVLSASLIPVYARLVKDRGQREADEVARTVLGLLAVMTSLLVLAGVIFTPFFVDLIAGGFEGPKRELTIALVRITFPGVGLLVASAWCLAILNTHGKFFNSYAAPVLWNAAIMTAILWYRHDVLSHVAVAAAWGAVVGSVLQLGAQVPQVLDIMSRGWRRTRLTITTDVNQVLTSSLPVILSRGAIQVSAFIDSAIASHLGDGPVSALGNAQSLYMFPVSLFGMAISSAALPAMSALSHDKDSRALAKHLVDGQRTLIVLMVPSVVAFVGFGDLMASLLFENGKFTHRDAQYVWTILAGSAVGLIATTVGRFYASAFYALGDTKTPARFALVRIVLVVALGFAMAFGGPALFHVSEKYGAVGLTLSAGIAGWFEFVLLRRALKRRIADFDLDAGFVARCWAMAMAAAALTTPLRWVFAEHSRYTRNISMLVIFGVIYLGGSVLTGSITLGELRRRLRV